jgi:N-acetylmuramoyl-L-alanine amidase
VRRHALLVALAVLPLLGVERPPGLGDVLDVRYYSHPDFTRVVVDLDRRVETEVVRLPADPGHAKPQRLYLDLGEIWVGRTRKEPIRVGDGILEGVRLGQNTLRSTRVVIDLESYHRHRLLYLSHPHRVVIDVWPRPRPSSPQALPTPLRPIRKVVVDAGHGGRDPGAIGVGGLREKAVTLQVAGYLGARLERMGFDVAYTRAGDETLSLEERTFIAQREQADLFLSVHANAARRRSVHGVETYYLDATHQRHTLNLAARENAIPRHQVDELDSVLTRIHIEEELLPHSRRLADYVHAQIVSGLPSARRPQDLGVKQGPFYVLFLSNMPAILVEVGFLTNADEARRLRDDAYLQALAEQMALGVERYRGEQDTRLARRGEE